MAFFKNDGRQSPAVAVVEFNLSDLDAGGTLNIVELPGSAIVTGGFITVTTAFNAQTTAVVKLGDAVADDRYGTGLNVRAAGRVALTPTGYITPRVGDLVLTYTETGDAATEGTATLVLEYIEVGKSKWTQG